jgi:hypothetical protein
VSDQEKYFLIVNKNYPKNIMHLPPKKNLFEKEGQFFQLLVKAMN